MRLNGKAAIVTGASKGLGYEIAVEFAREGADVLVNYCSDQTGAQHAVREIEKLGRKSLAFKADVSRKIEVDAMVEAAVQTSGKLDILVNNSGVAIWKPFLEIRDGGETDYVPMPGADFAKKTSGT